MKQLTQAQLLTVKRLIDARVLDSLEFFMRFG